MKSSVYMLENDIKFIELLERKTASLILTLIDSKPNESKCDKLSFLFEQIEILC